MDQHTSSQPLDRSPTGEGRSTSRSHVARHPLVMAVVIVLLLGTLALLNGAAPFVPAAPRATDAGVGRSSPSTQEFQRAVGAAAQLLPPSPTDLGIILLRLLLAALLGIVISFRGSRRRNEFLVVHTNMIIALTGAMMMIIIGSDLARAFGLVGVSSIARFRTPVGDPRALAALVVSMGAGVAVGVGLYELAIVATVLVVLVEFALERGGLLLSRGWYRPERGYDVELVTDTPDETLAATQQILHAAGMTHTLVNYQRGKKDETIKIGLAVGVPEHADTEKLTLQLLSAGAQSVSWSLAKEQ